MSLHKTSLRGLKLERLDDLSGGGNSSKNGLSQRAMITHVSTANPPKNCWTEQLLERCEQSER